jgi:hypothetical protein
MNKVKLILLSVPFMLFMIGAFVFHLLFIKE